MKLKIVTDSTVELTDEEVARYGIQIIPLSSMIENVVYHDDIEITNEVFLQKMKQAAELPKSSQPPVGKFLTAYNALTADGSEVLSIHVTETLSGTVHSAHQAADLADGKVTVIDSQFCARGMAFQVLAAAEFANLASSMEEMLAHLENIKSRTILYISIANLENMIKGGRIGKTMGKLTSLMDIKATLQMTDGKLHSDSKGRGTKSIVKRYKEICQTLHDAPKKVSAIGFTHVGMSDYSTTILDMLKTTFPHIEPMVSYASPSVMTHAGPEAISVQFLLEK
ncbi:DegV family protein [Carnobacterium pleistocenium]|uniref:DegV family protein n=1 Tax=Carnobacterium pleistocenium TaxID=181073 RepID=UPI000550F329|nr:DegV family protein [Carnobacterium pleistocenium]